MKLTVDFASVSAWDLRGNPSGVKVRGKSEPSSLYMLPHIRGMNVAGQAELRRDMKGKMIVLYEDLNMYL